MWQAITAAIGGIVQPIAGYFQRRRELTAQEHANALKVLEAQGERAAALVKLGFAADMQWEQAMVEQAATGWKDELTFLLVSIPAVLAFVKTDSFDGAAVVLEGFRAIDAMPWYYQTIFCSVLAANYGIRWWRRSQYDTENPTQQANAIRLALGDKK